MNYTTKVTVKHWRMAWMVTPGEHSLVRWYRKDHKESYFTPETKGGKTEVIIQVFDEHGDPLAKFVGVALCSMKDNFCYRIGREIAFGRALKQLDEWRNEHYGSIEMKYL